MRKANRWHSECRYVIFVGFLCSFWFYGWFGTLRGPSKQKIRGWIFPRSFGSFWGSSKVATPDEIRKFWFWLFSSNILVWYMTYTIFWGGEFISGIKNVLEWNWDYKSQSGIYSAATIRSILAGKNYTRSVEFHIMWAIAIIILKVEAEFGDGIPKALAEQDKAFREALHEDSNLWWPCKFLFKRHPAQNSYWNYRPTKDFWQLPRTNRDYVNLHCCNTF